ncbi:hypothetical protein [Pseudaminobacter salicylatoxidans]|uniref:hypothetical protein n=1 Tax=Pseudaminobacter salicylatoxidans TaxID=93369 RepID=UPI000D6D5661|nr:hypothetical protein [Pseudaminobacter salicylatoxidans]
MDEDFADFPPSVALPDPSLGTAVLEGRAFAAVVVAFRADFFFTSAWMAGAGSALGAVFATAGFLVAVFAADVLAEDSGSAARAALAGALAGLVFLARVAVDLGVSSRSVWPAVLLTLPVVLATRSSLQLPVFVARRGGVPG